MQNTKMSGLYKDFVTSHIRHQVKVLQNVLRTMECPDSMEEEYLDESLRRVVTDLHRIRKMCA